MVRKLSVVIIFSLLAFILVQGASAQCNARKIAREFKPNLAPYRYDNFAYNDITFIGKPQTIEIKFSAFAGMKYKLVFGTSLFDEKVQVNIYDKSIRNRVRNNLYKSSSGIDNLFWSVEVSEQGIYYVDYTIPPKGNSKSADGCMVMLIGYRQK